MNTRSFILGEVVEINPAGDAAIGERVPNRQWQHLSVIGLIRINRQLTNNNKRLNACSF